MNKTLIYKIKSSARTPKGVLKAIEKDSDWYENWDEHAEGSKLQDVIACLNQGFFEADGKNICIWSW